MTTVHDHLTKLEHAITNRDFPAEDVVRAVQGFSESLQAALKDNLLSADERISIQARVNVLLEQAATEQGDIRGRLKQLTQGLTAQRAYEKNK